MKHGNLLGMQLANNEDVISGNSTLLLNTQRIGQLPDNIEFCADLNAPSSTKNIPVGQNVKKSQMIVSTSNQSTGNTNTLGSGRRHAALAEEPVLSAKKR